jgi:hypothetical protein
MQWVTRQRPKVAGIACPWLIRRFIDPDAEIVYVPPERVLAAAEDSSGCSFDADGATSPHRHLPGGSRWCTFETLIHDHGLDNDRALVEMARIVHAADIAADVDTHPFGQALRAIGAAGREVEPDDQWLLERALFVYDALYAHCQTVTATTHDN